MTTERERRRRVTERRGRKNDFEVWTDVDGPTLYNLLRTSAAFTKKRPDLQKPTVLSKNTQKICFYSSREFVEAPILKVVSCNWQLCFH